MDSDASDNQSDQDLAEAMNRGDVEAFNQLYRRYRDWVMRLAFRFTGNHEDALDVVQETFAYLVRKCPGFKLTAAMTTFLYPAVRNLSIAANRKRNRSSGGDDQLHLFESVVQRSPSSHELDPLLSSLSSAHREILLMRFVDDMTQPEIAAALNLPLGTVKSRLHHAVQAVKVLPGLKGISSGSEDD